jgi:hypothetical protein
MLLQNLVFNLKLLLSTRALGAKFELALSRLTPAALAQDR